MGIKRLPPLKTWQIDHLISKMPFTEQTVWHSLVPVLHWMRQVAKFKSCQ